MDQKPPSKPARPGADPAQDVLLGLRSDEAAASHRAGRRFGFFITGLLAVAVAVLLGYAVWAKWGRGSQVPPEFADARPMMRSVPDVAATGDPISPLGDDNALPSVGRAGPGNLEYSRDGLSIALQNEGTDFLPGGRFEVNAPTAWLFTERGDALMVRSRELTCAQPEGSAEPESGVFTGDVTVELHRGLLPAGAKVHDIAWVDGAPAGTGEPDVRLATDSLSFESAVGRLHATSAVAVAGPGFECDLPGGFLAFVDEAGVRLAQFESLAGGTLRVTPSAVGEDSVAGSSDAHSASEDRGVIASAQRDDAAGVLSWYGITIEEDVFVDLGEGTLAAGGLRLWAELLDGRFPVDAVARFASVSQRAGVPSQDVPSGSGNTAHTGTAPEAVTLSWAGRLRLEPTDGAPLELAGDAVSIEFFAAHGGVSIASDSRGASANASSVWYGMTSRRLGLRGGAVLSLANAGEIRASSIEIDATEGTASLVGMGSLRAAGERDGSPDGFQDGSVGRSITWSEGADLRFSISGGVLSPGAVWPLQEAAFRGGVVVQQRGVYATGDRVTAIFDPSAGAQSGPGLRQVQFYGASNVRVDGDGELFADRFDADIVQDANGALRPTLVTASGAVRGSRDGVLFQSDLVEARFVRAAGGGVELSHLFADGAVQMRTPDEDTGAEFVVTSDTLRYDPSVPAVDLSGAPVSVRREGGFPNDGAPALLADRALRVELERGRVLVVGGGQLSYTAPLPGDAPGTEDISLTWSGYMQYDNRTGLAEFLEDCSVQATRGPLVEDTATGAKIVARLLPVEVAGSRFQAPSVEAQAASPTLGELRRGGAVRLQSVRIEGNAAAEATIESRRYKASPGASPARGRLLRRLVLRAQDIRADREQGHVSVPGPGRLVFDNHRPADRVNAGVDDADTAPDSYGVMRFEWDGSLGLDRVAGRALLERGVRFLHGPHDERGGITDSPEFLTVLDCERFEAGFGTGAGVQEGIDLSRVRASGAVWAKRGRWELVADELVYDTAHGAASVSAAQGNSVALFDAKGSPPQSGSLLRWDMLAGRVRWEGASSGVAPVR